ncbi:MAG: hypothetical protein HY505_01845 [Candidatus Yanofskybacteria bacterium]|nr:hypothetical protein [Candidatus Yanofskybacteria bacterium]
MTDIKNLPRDTFLYLLAIITLVVVAVGFGMAVFNYIDFYFPDSATDYYRYASSAYEGAIRQAMAMLIVVFPVFLWVSRFLRKDVALHPEKRELRIRKWLLNLTLFATALIIIGDLVAVINSFLTGELTMRFILKALTIFFISGSVFYYYLAQLRDPVVEISNAFGKDKSKSHYGARKTVKWLDLFSWIIVAVVVLTILWGFAVIGSPFKQRAKRFDERRVNDLSMIQSQIVNYWQRKESLPKELKDLEDSISGFFVPRDPQTGTNYEYVVDGSKEVKFKLCAMFNNSNLGQVEDAVKTMPVLPRGEYYSDSWQHDSGRQCFDRTIDPELYPPLNKLIK